MAEHEEMDTDEFNLLDFPDEILLKIFTNFDYIDFMESSQVCTRFERLAQEAFPMVYNGDTEERYFELRIDTDFEDGTVDAPQNYYPILQRFNKSIVAMKIGWTGPGADNPDHWVYEAINGCTSLTHVIFERNSEFDPIFIFRSVPKLTSLMLKSISLWEHSQWTNSIIPRLQSFGIKRVDNLEMESFVQFVTNNPQLKHLQLIEWEEPNEIVQTLIGRLDSFKSLKIYEAQFDSDSGSIYSADPVCKTDDTVDGLEFLAICVNEETAVDILRPIANECKTIKSLQIFKDDFDANESQPIHSEIIDAICLFDQVETLKLCGFVIPSIQTLMQRLTELNSLCLISNQTSDLTPDAALNLLTTFPNVKYLKFRTEIYRGSFDMQSCQRFIHFLRERNDFQKLQFGRFNYRLELTKDKFTLNEELRHWIGYEVERSRSQTSFLSLNEVCIEKIAEYLNKHEVRALYETCKLTKRALAERIAAQKFKVSIDADSSEAMNLVDRFGEHISKLTVDHITDDEAIIMDVWRLIGRICSKSLIELTICNGRVNLLNSLNLRFPNVQVMKLLGAESNGPYIFPLIDCPELNHLELERYTINGDVRTFQLGMALSGLKILKIERCESNMYEVLNVFSDDMCNQVEELTLNRTYHLKNAIVNCVVRFRNLVTLNLIIDNIVRADTKHLFKKCQKLKKLSLMYDASMNRKMFADIKEYCKQLKVIQLEHVTNNTDEFKMRDLGFIADFFPNVDIKLVKFDPNYHHQYKVVAYKEPTWDYRNPY